VSSRARGFEIEQRAHNACRSMPDAAGVMPRGPTVRRGGADVLRTTLPVPHLVLALKRSGIPAYASRDAGAYLCNAVLYHSLQIIADAGRDCRVGFVHVPASLARPGGPNRGRVGACPLTWPQAVEGGLEIIAGCLGRPMPKRRRRWSLVRASRWPATRTRVRCTPNPERWARAGSDPRAPCGGQSTTFGQGSDPVCPPTLGLQTEQRALSRTLGGWGARRNAGAVGCIHRDRRGRSGAAQRRAAGIDGTLGTGRRHPCALPVRPAVRLLFLAIVLVAHRTVGATFHSVQSHLDGGRGRWRRSAATATLLAAMRERSFVVTTAYAKTEPVQVALFGLVFLGDHVTAGVAAAIVIATAGVLLVSWPRSNAEEPSRGSRPPSASARAPCSPSLRSAFAAASGRSMSRASSLRQR
jgi:hypothetical protein